MAAQEFLAAYLAVGADEFKRQFVLERLEKRIAALGDLDFNKDVFVGSSTDADALITSLNMLPFASPYRLIIVKDADKLPKATSEALVSYLAAPCTTSILALDATKLAKSTRLYKAVAKVGKQAVISCEAKKGRELPAQVRDFAASEGVTITQRAAEALIARVGESTVHLDTELKKMASALGKGAVIDVPEVERFVARTSEPKPWLFTDALGARDAKRCFELLAAMPSQSPHGMLARSVTLVRELIVAKSLRGAGASALAAELGKQEWQVKNYFRWAAGYSRRELLDALVAAAETDKLMKSGGDPDICFQKWVLDVCSA